MVGTVGDSSTVISTPRAINVLARMSAVIQPALPPPTITILRTAGGPAARAGDALCASLHELLMIAVSVMPMLPIRGVELYTRYCALSSSARRCASAASPLRLRALSDSAMRCHEADCACGSPVASCSAL